MSKREGATEIVSRHSHEEKMRKGEKIYSGQTVVAEESRRFILLSLQRASLKSTLSRFSITLSTIKSATMMASIT